MKNLFFLLSIFSPFAHSTSLASIYNGTQFQMDGQLLVQDADHPDDFYFLPQTFRLKSGAKYDAKQRRYVPEPGVNHRVIIKDGQKYSVYTMDFELDSPSPNEILSASINLTMQVSSSAQIKGIAPVCGLRLAVPGMDTASPIPSPNPKATVIQYSISSTEADKCNSILAVNEFSMSITAPIEREPEIAQNLTSSVGMVLPPIELVLPYKYKDKVKVSVDAHSALEQSKAAVGLSGTIEEVTVNIDASMEHLWSSLTAAGQVNVDCQNPDHSICDRFVQQAQEILAKAIFLLTPDSSKGDTTPLVVGDKDKKVSGGLFKIGLAFDESSVTRDQKFTVDFSNTVYSSVHSQAQVVAADVPSTVLDPQVRTLLKP